MVAMEAKQKTFYILKQFFPKNLQEATNDYFVYVYDRCIINGYK
jgi:hypothetical protein